MDVVPWLARSHCRRGVLSVGIPEVPQVVRFEGGEEIVFWRVVPTTRQIKTADVGDQLAATIRRIRILRVADYHLLVVGVHARTELVLQPIR